MQNFSLWEFLYQKVVLVISDPVRSELVHELLAERGEHAAQERATERRTQFVVRQRVADLGHIDVAQPPAYSPGKIMLGKNYKIMLAQVKMSKVRTRSTTSKGVSNVIEKIVVRGVKIRHSII